jgi:hypothetical protein
VKFIPGLPKHKGAFKKTKAPSTSKLELFLSKKLVKCYSQYIALCGVTWSLQEVDQKHLQSFEMWRWRRKEKNIWTVSMINKDV